MESVDTYRWHEEDMTSIELVGNQVAMGIQAQLKERDEAAESRRRGRLAARATPPGPRRSRRDVTFYARDNWMLMDGEYLIRSMPGRILWKVLTAFRTSGGSSSQIAGCGGQSLGLPERKDNLETRLLLLRRASKEMPGHEAGVAGARTVRAGAGLRGDAEHPPLITGRPGRSGDAQRVLVLLLVGLVSLVLLVVGRFLLVLALRSSPFTSGPSPLTCFGEASSQSASNTC